MAQLLWCTMLIITACAVPAQAQRITWRASRGLLTPAEAAAVLQRAIPALVAVAESDIGRRVVTSPWRPGDGPFGPFRMTERVTVRPVADIGRLVAEPVRADACACPAIRNELRLVLSAAAS